MAEQFGEIQAMITKMATDTVASIIAFTPKLIGALFLLLVGWVIAKVLQIVLERSIRAGLDTLLERTGASAALERSAISTTPSAILGRLVFWLVMIVFIMGASEIIGLEAVSVAIQRVLGYLPSVISAAMVLAAGIFLSRFVGNLVTTAAGAAAISYAAGLGAVARTTIIVMVGVVTVEQLGIDTQILITVITVTVAALMFGLSLAFALGSTPVIRGILASHYLRQSLDEGGEVEVAGVTGTLEEIGPINSLVRDGDRNFRVPNSRLVDEVIKTTNVAS